MWCEIVIHATLHGQNHPTTKIYTVYALRTSGLIYPYRWPNHARPMSVPSVFHLLQELPREIGIPRFFLNLFSLAIELLSFDWPHCNSDIAHKTFQHQSSCCHPKPDKKKKTWNLQVLAWPTCLLAMPLVSTILRVPDAWRKLFVLVHSSSSGMNPRHPEVPWSPSRIPGGHSYSNWYPKTLNLLPRNR